ncbi:hypothetical protein HK101_005617, partial [Irineochytrium annulatum]
MVNRRSSTRSRGVKSRGSEPESEEEETPGPSSEEDELEEDEPWAADEDNDDVADANAGDAAAGEVEEVVEEEVVEETSAPKRRPRKSGAVVEEDAQGPELQSKPKDAGILGCIMFELTRSRVLSQPYKKENQPTYKSTGVTGAWKCVVPGCDAVEKTIEELAEHLNSCGHDVVKFFIEVAKRGKGKKKGGINELFPSLYNREPDESYPVSTPVNMVHPLGRKDLMYPVVIRFVKGTIDSFPPARLDRYEARHVQLEKVCLPTPNQEPEVEDGDERDADVAGVQDEVVEKRAAEQAAKSERRTARARRRALERGDEGYETPEDGAGSQPEEEDEGA